MTKTVKILLSSLLAVSLTACSSSQAGTQTSDGKFKPGTYEGTAEGRNGGTITVSVTVSENEITDVTVTEDKDKPETPSFGGPALEQMPQRILDAQSLGVDTVTNGTITSQAILDAAYAALEQSGADMDELTKPAETAAQENGEVTFKPGTYTGKGDGYNGPVELDVTFDEHSITDIQIVSSKETAHVGDVAYDIMFADMKEASGSGVDTVSGATFTSIGIKGAVDDAAQQAGADMDVFTKNTVIHEAGEPIEDTWDVVVVGAGGAGIAAAAQAAQDGNSVLVIEKNAEIGGNTLVSGGQYQSVMKYLVWDPENPDAETGTRFDGQEFPKVKAVAGQLTQLKGYLNWSEEPFDEEYYKTHEFVAGDEEELMKHGVHEEYLPVLKALKEEIRAYADWADAKIAAGAKETELALFSTENLHIFQTYYGGLRQSADGSSWEYGDVDLVTQMVHEGQDIKPWLMAMSEPAEFVEDQKTLIGALWYRENDFVRPKAQWETYFQPMLSAFNEGSEKNQIMLRTDAQELILDGDRVVGVKAVMYDGTEVTAHANKGVILATGGYAANLQEVVDTNVYWSEEFLSTSTKTTNRSSLQGDGIRMGVEAGGDTVGMGFTQLMPISWIDNGNLAFGGGNYAVFINPETGHRFVNETAERDVLSLAEFNNGISMLGSKGVFIEIANAEEPIPGPYLYKDEDVENRQWVRKVSELGDLFKELGLPTDAETVIEEIREYDTAYITGVDMTSDEFGQVIKRNPSRPIGNAEKNADGSYNMDTYDLENTLVRVRLMAPSTHHTMGGLKVDLDRHVLDAYDEPVEGLYAAGEVTGGIHGGNRLGGNAIVEIIVSGRVAAKAVTADNQ